MISEFLHVYANQCNLHATFNIKIRHANFTIPCALFSQNMETYSYLIVLI